LAEFAFVVGTPAATANFVVSEINYNPIAGAPGTALDKQEYEFIEFWNPTSSAVQLDGVSFTVGLTFNFTTQSSISVLAPGERLVLVKNLAAFQSRYPDANYPGLSAKIAGVYTGSLDNGGETLTLNNATTNADIISFRYDDEGSLFWPTSPDGGGSTLCFTNISSTTANADDALNWFAHATPRGNPGGPDAGSFAIYASANGVPATTADSDFDGMDNLLEYAMGSIPSNPSSRNLPTSGILDVAVGVNPLEPYQTITFNKLRDATDIRYRVQTSTELTAWQDNAVILDRTTNPDLTETVTFRAPNPISQDQRSFMRVKVELMP
jgi:Lamin Tail Domain